MIKKSESESRHAFDHSKELLRFKRIKGQVEGVEKMIRDQRFCSDILHQLRAIKSGISAIEASILEAHVKNSILEAFQAKEKKQAIEKIDEMIDLFKKATNKGVLLG